MYNAIIITPNTPEVAKRLKNVGYIIDERSKKIVIPMNKPINRDVNEIYSLLTCMPNMAVNVTLGNWDESATMPAGIEA